MRYQLKFIILLLLVFTGTHAYSSGAFASTAAQSISVPHATKEKLAEALSQLPAKEQIFFFQADYGTAQEEFASPGDDFQYQVQLNQSYSAPVWFHNLNDMNSGGVAAFNGHVFSEGFYRLAVSHGYTTDRATLQQVQPWLEWDTQNSRYNIRHGNSAQALLSPLVTNGKVKLYRGTDKRGLDYVEKVKNGDFSAMKNGTFGYFSSMSGGVTTEADSLFFTPTKQIAAEKWRGQDPGGGYFEIELSSADFDKVYAGIEFTYIEVAFSPEALQNSASSIVIHRNP